MIAGRPKSSETSVVGRLVGSSTPLRRDTAHRGQVEPMTNARPTWMLERMMLIREFEERRNNR